MKRNSQKNTYTTEYNEQVSLCCGAEITEYERHDEYCYIAVVCDKCEQECKETTYNEYLISQAESINT